MNKTPQHYTKHHMKGRCMVGGERASFLVPGKKASGGSTGMQEKPTKQIILAYTMC